ncbi:hypothetical protein K9M42_03080 [Patescibacteria group bacterium]|nr:hypothetical protein [Patescibacteria group bacterium]
MEGSPKQFVPQICKLKHEAIDKEFRSVRVEIKNIEEQVKQIEELKNKFDKHEIISKKDFEELSEKIEVSIERINKKINVFDIAFRGNGKVGIFEQVRDIKEKTNNVEEKFKKVYEHCSDMEKKYQEVVQIKEKLIRLYKIVKYGLIGMAIIIILVTGGEYANIRLGDKVLKKIKDVQNKLIWNKDSFFKIDKEQKDEK